MFERVARPDRLVSARAHLRCAVHTVRHVHGRPFVAHVHNADALQRHMVPDRLDVSTLQAEYTVDAARFQKSRDPGSAGQCIGVQVLRCCERLVHGCLFPAHASD